MATPRARSRSRERIISLAVMSELHRLPQDERKTLQILRNKIDDVTSLTQLGCLVKLMFNLSEKAHNLGCCSATFHLQAQLRPLVDQLGEMHQATAMQIEKEMVYIEKLFTELARRPDGAPYPMFLRAMDFSSRTHSLFKTFLNLVSSLVVSSRVIPPAVRMKFDLNSSRQLNTPPAAAVINFTLLFLFFARGNLGKKTDVPEKDDEMLRMALISRKKGFYPSVLEIPLFLLRPSPPFWRCTHSATVAPLSSLLSVWWQYLLHLSLNPSPFGHVVSVYLISLDQPTLQKPCWFRTTSQGSSGNPQCSPRYDKL